MNKIKILSAALICLFMTVSFESLAQAWGENALRMLEEREKSQGRVFAVLAVLAFAGFIWIGIWLKKQKLRRTNKYGTEMFASEGKFFQKTFSEGVANVAGVFLFICAVFFVFAALVKCN